MGRPRRWVDQPLPYLEEEAFGPVPARFRQYRYVNNSEFVAQACERGIELFAIVFEAQAWELPAGLVDGTVVAQTERRGVTKPTTVGLREFSQDTDRARGSRSATTSRTVW